MLTKASEKIREELSECQRAIASALHSDTVQRISTRVTALHWALELVEAQEKADAWTEFSAEHWPGHPRENDKRVLLTRDADGNVVVYTAYTWTGYTRPEWTSQLGNTLYGNRLNATHWRLITPPESAGGAS